ncbi:MAG: PorT family protein [Bacteroidales bacterium]|nr:PorT family protein [Bacteroidales bacterium]
MRNIIVSLILIIMLPGFMMAQEKEKPSRELKFSAYFSPDYTYRILEGDGEIPKSLIPMLDSLESPRFGYTAGIGLEIPINPKFALTTGIALSDKGEKYKQSSFVIMEPDSLLEDLHRVEIIHHYYFIEIPANIQYNLLTGNKLSLYVKGGLSFNFFVNHNQSITYFYKDGSEEEFSNDPDNKGFSTLSFGAIAAIGVRYQLTPQFELMAEPIFKHHFTSISETDLKQYPYSIGVNVGVAYEF